MEKEQQIPLFDLVRCLSEAMDMIYPSLVNHHMQVAYIAFCICEELGLPVETGNDLVLAGALHDIGALSMNERLGALTFEEVEKFHQHAELGCSLIKMFEQLSGVADVVRFHHVPWSEGRGAEFRGRQVSVGSHILHLADRVAVLVNRKREVLGQVDAIRKKIEKMSGKLFVPELVGVFKRLSEKEAFWFDIASPSLGSILHDKVKGETIELGANGLHRITSVFGRIIDFRSSFTATHSGGVAATAGALAGLFAFSAQECKMMEVAGYLHDLGKLTVPKEILEKPAPLTKAEFNVIRRHTYYTYQILKHISAFDKVNEWASFHHESINGTGYPFKLKNQQLSMGSRILAVADIFTALSEDRPYRKGIASNQALKMLQEMAGEMKLDAEVITTLKRHFDEINAARIAAQNVSIKEYRKLEKVLE